MTAGGTNGGASGYFYWKITNDDGSPAPYDCYVLMKIDDPYFGASTASFEAWPRVGPGYCPSTLKIDYEPSVDLVGGDLESAGKAYVYWEGLPARGGSNSVGALTPATDPAEWDAYLKAINETAPNDGTQTPEFISVLGPSSAPSSEPSSSPSSSSSGKRSFGTAFAGTAAACLAAFMI